MSAVIVNNAYLALDELKAGEYQIVVYPLRGTQPYRFAMVSLNEKALKQLKGSIFPKPFERKLGKPDNPFIYYVMTVNAHIARIVERLQEAELEIVDKRSNK